MDTQIGLPVTFDVMVPDRHSPLHRSFEYARENGATSGKHLLRRSDIDGKNPRGLNAAAILIRDHVLFCAQPSPGKFPIGQDGRDATEFHFRSDVLFRVQSCLCDL